MTRHHTPTLPLPLSYASPMVTYHAELSLACTYAIRCPALARQCARDSLLAAVRMGRPDLAFCANSLLSSL